MNKPTKWTQTITLPHLCTGVITREAKQLENPKHVFLVKRSRALKLTNCTGVGEIVGIVDTAGSIKHYDYDIEPVCLQTQAKFEEHWT